MSALSCWVTCGACQRIRQVLGRLAADVGHRLDVHLAPLREIRQRRGRPGARRRRPTAGPSRAPSRRPARSVRRDRSRDLADVHAELARVTPHRRRGGHRSAPHRRARARLQARAARSEIDHGAGFAARAGRGAAASRALSASRPPRAWGSRRPSARAPRQGAAAARPARALSSTTSTACPTLTLSPGLTRTSATGSTDARGHLYRRLVGFELEHRLILLDDVSDRHEHADDIALLDVLAKFGQCKFSRHQYPTR